MKIVNREEFLKLPEFTLYAKYKQNNCEYLCIKKETLLNDWFYIPIGDVESDCTDQWLYRLEEMEAGANYPMEIIESRDGYFTEDQLFMIYEKEDVALIIETLKKCLA